MYGKSYDKCIAVFFHYNLRFSLFSTPFPSESLNEGTKSGFAVLMCWFREVLQVIIGKVPFDGKAEETQCHHKPYRIGLSCF